METAPTYTLREVVEKFLLRQFNDARKHYIKYFAFAKDVWKDLFSQTLWVVKNTYVPVIKGTPYNYIEVPPNMYRFLSLSIQNPNGSLTPVYYNKNINFINRKLINKRCNKCECTGLNHDVDSLITTTKSVIIDDETYYEKSWAKVCENGDVVEYREIPTKKYTTENDYTIVTHPEQRTICKLEVKECGCVKDTDQNRQLFYQTCGCYLIERSVECDKYLCRSMGPAGMKLSEDGTKIYLSSVSAKYLLLSYQITINDCDEEILVPEYSWKAIAFGIENESKMFNPTVPAPLKDKANWDYIREKNKVFLWQNPISLSELAEIGLSGKWGGGLTLEFEQHNIETEETKLIPTEPYTATEIIASVTNSNVEEIIKIEQQSTLHIPWTAARQSKFQRFPHLEVWVKEGAKYYLTAFQPSADLPLTSIDYDFGGNIDAILIMK